MPGLLELALELGDLLAQGLDLLTQLREPLSLVSTIPALQPFDVALEGVELGGRDAAGEQTDRRDADEQPGWRQNYLRTKSSRRFLDQAISSLPWAAGFSSP